jgi:hypothetical protein
MSIRISMTPIVVHYRRKAPFLGEELTHAKKSTFAHCLFSELTL